MFANWEHQELRGAQPPSEYAFRLQKGGPASGRIIDEAGKPIASAKVQLKLNNAMTLQPANGDGRVRFDTWLAQGKDALTTDADGRWRIEHVPSEPGAQLGLMVTHPGFISDLKWGQLQAEAGITTEQMRE